MSSNSETQENNSTLELVDIQITKDSLMFIKSQIDDIIRSGKYGFDEAQKVIISVNNVFKGLETLDKLQTLALQIKQRQEQIAKEQN